MTLSAPGTGPPTPLVAVGASAGGVEALTAFVRGLPQGLDAPVLVVLHQSAEGRSRLAEILGKAGPLPATVATAGQSLQGGRILVATPGVHLLVEDGAILLGRGAKENGHRPAVDPLFRSAALWGRERAVAVVLSGTLDDGAAGAAAVVSTGGVVLVQDPDEAVFASMPRAALAAAPAATVAVAGDLGRHVAEALATGGERTGRSPSDELVWETQMAEMDDAAVSGVATPGEPVPVSCPDCHGAMSRLQVGPAVTYRCHVGHAYGPLSLLQAQSGSSEAALWMAVASLEEQAAVLRDLAETADPEHATTHLEQARLSHREGAPDPQGPAQRAVPARAGQLSRLANAAGQASISVSTRGTSAMTSRAR